MLGGGAGSVAIESDDPVQLALLRARIERAVECHQALHDSLAWHIAQRIGELFTD